MAVPEIQLSSNDAHVLSALFDPEASSSSSAAKIESSLPPLPHISHDEIAALHTTERAAILPIAIPNPSKPEIERSIAALSQLIDSHPRYASAYTNRAQALRLAVEDDLFTVDDDGTVERIFLDLAKAIELATPASQKEAVSPQQAKVLAAAHSHRAYLYLKAAKVASESPSMKLESGSQRIKGMGHERLEEMASRDFEAAGRYGDRVAKDMAVRTNPYAKMCGAIVRNALKEEVAEGRR
ncbi:uncharacterized protein BDZ99DRAFT_461855 [Mytilinidion resinicola]|uniref:Uncharacterized protein n=1 Tax=Mytilinidion resinicola TaxID=574789 RepID=A0A6A6YSH0_9PEZI|nr:uncharacterized protein BDZ99DRAFT_461855 [Mytilinidion resinicola]KAF2811896.1 hypothetical protein BDZ99DRAFT_461855 [Mytilinidion resinicola]